MKKPKLLTILIKFYSLKWMKTLIGLFRTVSIRTSSRYITIQFKKNAQDHHPTPQKTIPTYFVYILRSLKNGKFYIGTTDNLNDCIKKHNQGAFEMTKKYSPLELVYYEARPNYYDAKERERFLKTTEGNTYIAQTLKRYLLFHPPKSTIRKNLKVVSFVSILLLAVLSPTIIAILYGPKQTQAEWFSTAWSYRQKVTIGNTGSADANKKVKLDIDTATLTTDKLQADCDDIRFTDSNGKLLSFYLDSSGGACDTASTDYYVLVPTINSGDTILYLYYGNPSAGNAGQSTQFTQETFSPTSGPTNASEENGPGPVAYWAFDEGYGSTARDSSQNKNTTTFGATTAAPTWKSESDCLSGKCIYFDGSNDEASFPQVLPSGAWSVSLWVKHNNDSGVANDFLFWQQESQIFINHSTDTISARLWNGTSQYSVTSTTALTAGQWYYVTFVYDTSNITLFINAKQEATLPASGNAVAGTGYFGRDETTDSMFRGSIDEAKVYNYVRSAAQIKTDYVGKGTPQGVAASFGQPNQDFLNNGLVGYWKMDDAGIDAEGESSTDSSGNSNTGSLFGDNSTGDNGTGMDCTTKGKFGTSCDLDGTDDFISITTPQVYDDTNFTVSAWVNIDAFSNNETIYSEGRNASTGFIWFFINGQNLELRTNDASNFNQWTGTTSLSSGQWYHVSVVKQGQEAKLFINGVQETLSVQSVLTNGAIPTLDRASIGQLYRSTNDYFTDGKIDELRLYNRALSPAEIQSLYNWAPGPVGYWKMDEGSWTNNCSTATVFDSSGNDNSGIACPSSTGPTGAGIGKFGKTGVFDGSNDYVQIDSIDEYQFGSDMNFTLEAWVKTTSSGHQRIISKFNPQGWYLMMWTTARIDLLLHNGTSQLQVNVIPTNINDGAWHHIAVAVDRSAQTATGYLDGVRQTPADISSFSGSLSSTRSVSFGGTSQFFNGSIDEVKIYNYARTSSQIVSDMNGGHPIGGSPIGSQISYWSFDEGYGDRIYDQLLNNTGDIGGSSQTCPASGSTTCPTIVTTNFHKGFHFDASDDYIDIGNISEFKIPSKTITMWINQDDTPSTTEAILSANYANWYVGVAATNRLITSHMITAGTQQTTYSNTSVTNPGTWQHVAYVFDVTGSTVIVRFYVDGKPAGETSYTTGYYGTYGTDFILGGFTSSSFMYDGQLDEVKIYNDALTQEQILIDMNANASINFGTGHTEKDQITDGAGNEPVGWWTFDEKVDNTCTGGSNDVCDRSGNGNDGAKTNMLQTWEPGKFGATLDFDGSDDYVQIADDDDLDFGTGAMSVSVWVNTTFVDLVDLTMILDKKVESSNTAGYNIQYEPDGDAYFRVANGSAQAITVYSNYPINDGRWHHIVGVLERNTPNEVKIYVDGTIQAAGTNPSSDGWNIDSSQNLVFGRRSNAATQHFDGKIDEVKLWNYALTPAQIVYEYNRGAPLVHWQFDECSGSTAYDISMHRAHGTITPGASGNTAVGTCTSGTSTHMWYNGVTGKRNASLDFDGTDDYVTIADQQILRFNPSPQDFSLFAWVKRASNGAMYIISKEDADNDGWRMMFNSSNQLVCSQDVSDATSTSSITDTNWHAVTCTIDRNGNMQTWIDGKANGTPTALSSDLMSVVSSITIGTRSYTSTSYFDGQIDDVRLYSYTLSEEQIQKIINDSSSVRFGPSTGQP